MNHSWAVFVLFITWATIWVWAVAHQLVLYWIFNAIVDAMPPVDQTSNVFYRWLYGLLHFVAANVFSRVPKAVKPPVS